LKPQVAVSAHYLLGRAGGPETARACSCFIAVFEFGVHAYLIVLIGIVRDDLVVVFVRHGDGFWLIRRRRPRGIHHASDFAYSVLSFK
jgi:hypothetical protein